MRRAHDRNPKGYHDHPLGDHGFPLGNNGNFSEFLSILKKRVNPGFFQILINW